MKLQFNSHPVFNDSRYVISKEFAGEPTAVFVFRFAGEFVASSKYYETVLVRAVGHKAVQSGAQIIEAIEA